jgi:hypothetical protein
MYQQYSSRLFPLIWFRSPQLLVANMDDLVRVRTHLPGQSLHSTNVFPSRQRRSPLLGLNRASRARPSRVRPSKGRLALSRLPLSKLNVQLPTRSNQKGRGGSNRQDGASGSDSDTVSAALGGQSKTQALLQTDSRRFSLTPRAKLDMIPLAVSVGKEAHANPTSARSNADKVRRYPSISKLVLKHMIMHEIM